MMDRVVISDNIFAGLSSQKPQQNEACVDVKFIIEEARYSEDELTNSLDSISLSRSNDSNDEASLPNVNSKQLLNLTTKREFKTSIVCTDDNKNNSIATSRKHFKANSELKVAKESPKKHWKTKKLSTLMENTSPSLGERRKKHQSLVKRLSDPIYKLRGGNHEKNPLERSHSTPVVSGSPVPLYYNPVELTRYNRALRKGRRGAVISLEINQSISSVHNPTFPESLQQFKFIQAQAV